MTDHQIDFGIASDPLARVAYGKGRWIYDENGKEYLDGSGGAAIFSIGHADQRVNAAIQSQMGNIAQAYRTQFRSEPADTLATIIAKQCGGGLEQIYFVSGGSEAVESCLKIALQYQQAIGETSRTRFIARRRSYHGNTLGALSVSGHPKRRSYFTGSLLPVSFVSAIDAYRPMSGTTPETVASAAAAELEAEILRVGPENVCAFIYEPVVGAAGCVLPAPAGYAQQMQTVCKKYNVLLIADEVMSGCGRIGSWRASAFDGIEPDLVALAKGLGAGYMPIGAAVYQTYIAEAITQAYDSPPMTGHTFSGHTAACAAAVAVQNIIQEEMLVERVAELGDWFGATLQKAVGSHDAVGNIRGRGFFWGVEFVADQESKQPFDPERQIARRVELAMRAEGLLAYPVSSIVSETHGDGVLFAPAYNASREEMVEMGERLKRALQRVAWH